MLTALKWLFYLIAAIALIIVGGSFLLPAPGGRDALHRHLRAA